jgi:hypothetical protein
MTMTRRTAAEVAAVRQLRRALDGAGCTEAQRPAPDAVRQRCSASPSPGVVVDEPASLGSRLVMTGSALLLVADGVFGGVVIAATSHSTFNLASLVIVLAIGVCLVGAATFTSWWALAHPSKPRKHLWSRVDDTDGRPLASPSHRLA